MKNFLTTSTTYPKGIYGITFSSKRSWFHSFWNLQLFTGKGTRQFVWVWGKQPVPTVSPGLTEPERSGVLDDKGRDMTAPMCINYCPPESYS